MVAIVAIMARTLYLWQFSQTLLFDAAVGVDVIEYHEWALEILAGRVLWTRVHIHAPLYSYFLALLYWLTDVNIGNVRVLQAGLELGALVLTAATARLLFSRRAALITACIWALYAPLIYYASQLFSEALLLFLVSLALFLWSLATRHLQNKIPRLCAMGSSGLAFGLAAVTHPLILPSIGLLTVYFAWDLFGRKMARSGSTRIDKLYSAPVRKRRASNTTTDEFTHNHGAAASFSSGTAFSAFILMLGMLILPIALTSWRNSVISGEFVLIQDRAGMNFYIGNNPQATGTCYLRPGLDYAGLVRWPRQAGITGISATKEFYYKHSLAYIREQPVAWVTLLLRKAILTWNTTELTSGPDLPQARYATNFMRLPLLRFGIVGPLALAGLWFMRRKRTIQAPLLLILGYWLGLTLFVTSGRYRVGMMPGIMLMAGCGLNGFLEMWRRQNVREFVTGTGVLLFGLAVAFLPEIPDLPSAEREYKQLMAEAAMAVEDYQLAENWALDGHLAAPSDPCLNHLLGALAVKNELYNKAVAHLRVTLQQDPQNAEAHIDLALAFSGMNALDEAENELMLALQLQPTSGKAWYNLAVLAEKQQQSNRAAVYYQNAIRDDPKLVSAQLNYALLLHRQGAYELAHKHYLTALRLQPEKANTLIGMAALMADTGRVQDAMILFEKALAAAPQRIDVWLAYAAYLRENGNPDHARVVLRQAQKLHADSGALAEALASE